MRSNVAAVLVFALVMGLGCWRQAGPSSPPAKLLTRAEFRDMLMGKSQEDVLKLAGKPDSTSDDGDVYWHYKDRTYDPVTGNPDSSVQVVFERGKRVRSVNY